MTQDNLKPLSLGPFLSNYFNFVRTTYLFKFFFIYSCITGVFHEALIALLTVYSKTQGGSETVFSVLMWSTWLSHVKF